jgi:hypothetical protein
MKREPSVPRQDWPTCLDDAGLTFHSEEAP